MTNSVNLRSVLGRRTMLSYKYKGMISHYMSICQNFLPTDYEPYVMNYEQNILKLEGN